MAQNKTQPTARSVADFLAEVTPDVRREDARTLCTLMARLASEPPTLWGPTIIGFGSYHYRYDSGREGDMMRVGFAPRKPATVLYIHGGFPEYEALVGALGKISRGKGCIYVKRLADLDIDVLETLITESLADLGKLHPPA